MPAPQAQTVPQLEIADCVLMASASTDALMMSLRKISLPRLQLPVATLVLHQAIAPELEIADFALTVFASTDA